MELFESPEQQSEIGREVSARALAERARVRSYFETQSETAFSIIPFGKICCATTCADRSKAWLRMVNGWDTEIHDEAEVKRFFADYVAWLEQGEGRR